MSSLACSECQATFDTAEKKKKHQRNCKVTGTMNIGGALIDVTRGTDGSWMCYCSDSGCPKPFANIASMRTHIKRAGTYWKGQEHVPKVHTSIFYM